jgi:hypothetical protein
MLTDRRTAEVILAEWRQAERELSNCVEGSAEYEPLASRVRDLAGEYRALIEAAVRNDPASKEAAPTPAP